MTVLSDVAETAVESARERLALGRRRLVFAVLVLSTIVLLLALMAALLSTDGMSFAEWGMLAGFVIAVPWNALGFWNAVVGFALLRFARDPARLVNPALGRVRAGEPPRSRVALAMCVRNEGTERVFRHLRLIEADLLRAGLAEPFDMFILSDSTSPEVVRLEEGCFAEWRSESPAPHRLHYRRRNGNAGYKAGNLRDFCERWGGDYDILVVLDADSLMSADAILRLVGVMEADPRLGILQSLTVGLPADSLFARLFQFGMRQGMRTYTMGSAWWQGDCGPYWGHNAAIRLKPFIQHCRLPKLPGGPPLGGDVLSHDQIEAVLMRRAGYEVRVVPEEGGSYEENPPSLPEFVRRDLRWCQGNMQYWRLLGIPGLKAVSRVQIWIALLMYFGAPGWLIFVGFGLAEAVRSDGAGYPGPLRHVLFWLTAAMIFSPILSGVLEVLMSRRERARYGGAGKVVAGALAALVLTVLLAPVMAVAQTILMAGFLFRRTIRWEAPNRDSHYVPLRESLRGLWPQLVLGLAYAAILWQVAPGAVPWASPLLAGLLLAVPLSSFTSSVAAGRRAAELRLCAIPEEIEPVAIVSGARDRCQVPPGWDRGHPVRPRA